MAKRKRKAQRGRKKKIVWWRRWLWHPLRDNRRLQLLLVSPALLLVFLLLIFSILPVPTSSFMLQSPVKPVAHAWVPMERITPWAALAIVAAEDQRFPQHWGLDVKAMWGAFKKNWRNRHTGRRVGGSTITQQLAKNLFLWPGGYVRKLIEAPITLLIELLWSKQRILEVYLNVAEFGPGVYGIEAASRRYFGKSAAQITPGEAARLAVVLPNPRQRRVNRPTESQHHRTAWVLRQMQVLKLDYIKDL